MADVATVRILPDSRRHVPVSVYLIMWATVGLVTGFFIATFLLPQVTGHAFSAPTTLQAQRVPDPYPSAAGVGMVLNFVKPEKTSDFETIVARLRDALEKSDKPERRRLAANWRVFKAIESGADGSVLYVFTVDSTVKDAGDTVSTILAEAFPAEGQMLYKRYAGAYAAGQRVVDLTLFSQPGR